MNFRPVVTIILYTCKFLIWKGDKSHVFNNIPLSDKRHRKRSARVRDHGGQGKEIFFLKSNVFKAAEKSNEMKAEKHSLNGGS